MSEAVREKMKKNLTEKLLAMLYGSSGRGGERRRMGAPTDARLCHHLAADNHLQIQTDSLPEMTEERNRRNTHTHLEWEWIWGMDREGASRVICTCRVERLRLIGMLLLHAAVTEAEMKGFRSGCGSLDENLMKSWTASNVDYGRRDSKKSISRGNSLSWNS